MRLPKKIEKKIESLNLSVEIFKLEEAQARSELKLSKESSKSGSLADIEEISVNTRAYYFHSNLKAYPDWLWKVVVVSDAVNGRVSCIETHLLPTESSIYNYALPSKVAI